MKILAINDCAYVAHNLSDAINHYAYQKHSSQHLFSPLKKNKNILVHCRNYFRFCWQLRKISKNFDLVIIHFARHGLLALFCRTAIIIHCHGDDVRNLASYPLYIRLFVKTGLKKAIKIFYSTPDLKAQLLDYQEKSFFLPSSIVLNETKKNRQESQNTSGLTVMFISKLDALKGMEIMPQVVSQLVLDNRIAKIKILDFGLIRDDVMVANHPKIEKLSFMSKNDYLQHILECDIAIGQQSPYGAFGVSELDAMNCSKPLISYFIFDDVYLTSPPFNRADDANSLIKEIDKLLSMTSQQRDELGEKNYHWVKKHHSQEVVSEQFIKHIEGLL